MYNIQWPNTQVDTLATSGVSLPGLTVEHVDLKARAFSASITRTVHVDMPAAASTSATQQQQLQQAGVTGDDHNDDVHYRRPSALHRDVSIDLTLDADDNMTGVYIYDVVSDVVIDVCTDVCTVILQSVMHRIVRTVS
jgi:hypothetical protein